MLIDTVDIDDEHVFVCECLECKSTIPVVEDDVEDELSAASHAGNHTKRKIRAHLQALCSGAIVFEPGSKVTHARPARSTVKARSQFRINTNDLGMLYRTLTAESLTGDNRQEENIYGNGRSRHP